MHLVMCLVLCDVWGLTADSGAAVESEQERLTADEEDGVVANDATSDDGA